MKRPQPARQRAPRYEINDKPIVDVTKPLIFSVGTADTRGSKAKDPEKCAAARAIRRQCNDNIVAAHVFRSRVYVEYPDRVERYYTPGRLRQETISFDRGSSPKYMEGDYRLLPASRSRKLGADRRKRPNPGNPNGHPGHARDLPRFDVEGARPMGGHVHFVKPTT